MSKWNLLVFGVYPYVALAICLLGSWARFDLSQYTWKAGSSQMLNNRGMRVASNFFHIGVLFVLAVSARRPSQTPFPMVFGSAEGACGSVSLHSGGGGHLIIEPAPV